MCACLCVIVWVAGDDWPATTPNAIVIALDGRSEQPDNANAAAMGEKEKERGGKGES